MLKCKTIVVQGEVVMRGNFRVSTLAENIDKKVSEFLGSGVVVEKVVPYVNFSSAADGGSALFLILYQEKSSRK